MRDERQSSRVAARSDLREPRQSFSSCTSMVDGQTSYVHTYMYSKNDANPRRGALRTLESSDTRYPLLSRCSSCFTKKSEFVLSFLLILIVPCLSTCVIYTSSSNLVARRASSLSSKQGTRSLLSSATWTNHAPVTTNSLTCQQGNDALWVWTLGRRRRRRRRGRPPDAPPAEAAGGRGPARGDGVHRRATSAGAASSKAAAHLVKFS